MSNIQQDDFFNYLIKGMDSKMQAQLNLMYARNKIMDEYNRKQEMAQMKKEITEDVLSQIDIRIKTEGLDSLRELKKLIDSFGK